MSDNKIENKKLAHNNNNVITATIKNIIVALLVAIILLLAMYAVMHEKINNVVSLIDRITVETNNKVVEQIKLDDINKKLINYPEYGTKYATIKIESLGIELPLYYGDTLSLLRNGAGQSSGSYFPGEGGTISCMAHNTSNMFQKLPNIENGAIINITTSYGEFNYKVYDTKVVDMTDLDSIPIQKEKEMLAVYTCYPVYGIGHKTHRFVAYAELV